MVARDLQLSSKLRQLFVGRLWASVLLEGFKANAVVMSEALSSAALVEKPSLFVSIGGTATSFVGATADFLLASSSSVIVEAISRHPRRVG